MKRVPDDLRAAYQSLMEAEGEQPGHDYDRGYLTGWYDARRGIRKRIRPDGGYRERERVAEFHLGYVHGREDGVGRDHDWWPDHARRTTAVQGIRPESRRPATTTPTAVPGPTTPPQSALGLA